MQLYFGPNFRYFFHDGKGNYKYRAPKEFIKIFNSYRILTIHNVAFGTGESFFVSFTADDGSRRAWWELEDDYPKLHSWLHLEGVQHDYGAVCVSLGLDGAFFAASNQGHRWRNIPEGACDYYQKFTSVLQFTSKRVNTIDLGFNDTYMGIGVDNTWFWDLGAQYPHFSSLGLEKELPRASWVTINPFAPDQHFAVFSDGSTHYSVPAQLAGDIAELFRGYAEQTMQAQQPSQQLPSGVTEAFNANQTIQAQQKRSRFGRLSSSGSQGGRPGMEFFQQYLRPQQSQQQVPHRPMQQQTPQQHPSTVNEALHLANNAFDTYNNVTNVGSSGAGGGFDVNQAMTSMQNSVDTINNIASIGGEGMNIANQIASNGLMVGQVAGQMVGAAAACSVM